MEEGGRAAKRPRLGSEERSEGASTTLPVAEAVKHLLYVQWFGTAGQSKLNKLQLRRLDDLEALQVCRNKRALCTFSCSAAAVCSARTSAALPGNSQHAPTPHLGAHDKEPAVAFLHFAS
jgi:hypothetical protein